jgi:WD40 repeat protein
LLARNRAVPKQRFANSPSSEELSTPEALDSEIKTVKLTPPSYARASSLAPANPSPMDIPSDFYYGYQAHSDVIHALVVTSDGANAFSASADGKVVQSSLGDTVQSEKDTRKNGKARIDSRVLYQSDKPVLSLALSPDDRYLAMGQIGSVAILDLQTQKFIKVFTRIVGRVTALAWDPRQEVLLIGLANGDVFGWNLVKGKSAGTNSLDALETYSGGISPIVALIFHPTGRSFFAIEREGIVSFWRLGRTTKELGLRQEDSIVDQAKPVNYRQAARAEPLIAVTFEDAFLSTDGQFLFVAANNGVLYQWKIRGFRVINRIQADNSAVFGVSGSNIDKLKNKHFLVSSGRSGGLKFWCLSVSKEETAAIPEGVIEELGSKDESTLEIETASPVSHAFELQPVADTQLFSSPVGLLRFGPGSAVLWGAQKTGNLLVFYVNSLKDLPNVMAKINSCKG